MRLHDEHQHEHDDQHGHAGHAPAAGRVASTPLIVALAITASFMIVEIIGGLLTNSLALLADAGHMATDAAALGLALFAAWLAGRPATPERSFGYYRAEVLAALVNAAALIVVSIYILWEAVQRFSQPPEIESGLMLVIAVAGLAANAAAAWALMRGGGHRHNVNIRGALLHVAGDMLGSLGAIVAALIMLATGWYLADPILSAGIGLLILRSSWALLTEAVNILLEATPEHIDVAEVRAALQALDGVEDVHDVHIRTVTSGLIAMSGHVEVSGERDWHDILMAASTVLRERFGIAHVTLQPEAAHCLPESFRGCSLDSPEGQQACLVPMTGHHQARDPHRH